MNQQRDWVGAPSTSEAGEQTIVSGIFGTVTNKRIIFQRAKSWLSGGSRQDIALNHVTSVRLDTTRHLLGATLLVLLGLGGLWADGFSAHSFGAVSLAFAVLLSLGSPTVVLNTSGDQGAPATGLPWQRRQAEEFVEAVREQIVRRGA